MSENRGRFSRDNSLLTGSISTIVGVNIILLVSDIQGRCKMSPKSINVPDTFALREGAERAVIVKYKKHVSNDYRDDLPYHESNMDQHLI